MTHDELLALVTGGTNHKMAEEHLFYRKALRAVVELHKPSQEVGGICDENGEELWVCGICPDGDGLQNYPCPTIQQIIEKELK